MDTQSLATALVRAVLSLLLAAQSHAPLPSDIAQSAQQLSQQAIVEANAIMSMSSAGTTPTPTGYAAPNAWSFVSLPTIGAPTQLIPQVVSTTSVAAPTCTITVSSDPLAPKESPVLTWTSAGVTSGTISNFGTVGPSGTRILTPGDNTLYYGRFTGPSGTAFCTGSVQSDSLFSLVNIATSSNVSSPVSIGTTTSIGIIQLIGIPVPLTRPNPCIVHTAWCGAITVPDGSYAEDTRQCGSTCVFQLCKNGSFTSTVQPDPNANIVSLSCSAEPYSE